MSSELKGEEKKIIEINEDKENKEQENEEINFKIDFEVFKSNKENDNKEEPENNEDDSYDDEELIFEEKDLGEEEFFNYNTFKMISKDDYLNNKKEKNNEMKNEMNHNIKEGKFCLTRVLSDPQLSRHDFSQELPYRNSFDNNINNFSWSSNANNNMKINTSFQCSNNYNNNNFFDNINNNNIFDNNNYISNSNNNFQKQMKTMINSSFTMNGKNGWICSFCKNFNYESK